MSHCPITSLNPNVVNKTEITLCIIHESNEINKELERDIIIVGRGIAGRQMKGSSDHYFYLYDFQTSVSGLGE